MIKCLECGKEMDRLQWTHFKYKCSGRFNNSKEYLNAYPDALLVDRELALRTAVTIENLIQKYGEIEGHQRWDEYRRKQALSNTYEYKKEKYNWTLDEFDSFNQSRAVTLQNMIEKYGEDVGLLKWELYCDKQKYTNSLEYFKTKYGNDGEQKWEEFCKTRGNGNNVSFVMKKHNIDIDAAKKLISERLSSSQAFVSKNEMEFVDTLEPILADITNSYKNKQFCIWNNITHTPMFYDIASSTRKKIIEYNGDYWHANPQTYESSHIISQSGLTASEIWERDALKLKNAQLNGYDILIVWESEYLTNKDIIIEKIKKWWNDEH